jgi:Protein of unknown function (DUF3239)
MSYFVDPSTQASTPGHLLISSSKYIAYRRLKGIKKNWYSVILLLPEVWLKAFLLKDEVVHDFLLKQEHFQLGCINPAVVINAKEGLIATFTNLSFVEHETWPVIKISQEPLDLISKTEIKDGARLATVALYYRNRSDEHTTAWADFDPKVAGCFTDDDDKCAGMMTEIRGNAWKCLELGLRQIPQKDKIGLYHLNLDSDLVSDSY